MALAIAATAARDATPKPCQETAARRRDTAPNVALAGAAAKTGTAPQRDDSIHGARIDWATLLQRVHDVDALACPCGGRLRVIALITEPAVASAILTALHLPALPPPIARARLPDDCDVTPD